MVERPSRRTLLAGVTAGTGFLAGCFQETDKGNDDGGNDDGDDVEEGDDGLDSAPFEVAALEPASATVNANTGIGVSPTVDVAATITNAGDEEETRDVEVRVDDEPLAIESVTVEGGADETVSFDTVDVSNLGEGEHTYGVYTDGDEATGTLTVQTDATWVSTWSHESVGHAEAFETLVDQEMATVMEFDHWNCLRLRGAQQGPGLYQDIVDAGYVPQIVWLGPNSVEGDGPWPEGTPAGGVYQEGGDRHGEFCQDVVDGVLDEKLSAIAGELARVESPVLWVPWEEANGGWRPSIGTATNGPETWAAAWRHMYDLFEEEGADNLVWVLAPSGNVMRDQPVGHENGLDAWYPGDDYVDYVGVDFYDHGGDFHSDGSPAEIFDELVGQYDTVTDERKPFLMNEIGSHLEDGDRADDAEYTPVEWTSEAIRAMRENDRIVGFVWWDAPPDLHLTNQDWGQQPTETNGVGEVYEDAITDERVVGNTGL